MTTFWNFTQVRNLLLRSAFLTIYRAFVRPHLDYGDNIYDEAYNASFHQKLESTQYKACLAMRGAIKGSSKKKYLSRTRFGIPFIPVAGIESCVQLMKFL